MQIIGNESCSLFDFVQDILHLVLERSGQFLEHGDHIADGGNHRLEPVPDVVDGLLDFLFHLSSSIFHLRLELVDLPDDMLLQLAQQVLEEFLERAEVGDIGIDVVKYAQDSGHQALDIGHAIDGIQGLEMFDGMGEKVLQFTPTDYSDGDGITPFLDFLHLAAKFLGDLVGVVFKLGGLLDRAVDSSLDRC